MAELRDVILEAARSTAHHQTFMQLDTFGQLDDIAERLKALVDGRDVPNGSMRTILEHARHVNGTLNWLTVSHLTHGATAREINWEQYIGALIRIARTGTGSEVIKALRHTLPTPFGDLFSWTITEASNETDWEQLQRDATLLCRQEHRDILSTLLRRRGSACDIHELANVARASDGRPTERRLFGALCAGTPHVSVSELHRIAAGLTA